MSNYGVLPTGFNRKPLAVILAEIEQRMIALFGPEIIQTPQSPIGQINALMADVVNETWEMAQDIYQSYDPDQAEGQRLDTLAKLRLLTRYPGETDADFRRSVSNVGRARIDTSDLRQALLSLTGVTYAQIFVNDTSVVDGNGIDPHSLAIAVIGGSDEEVAATARAYVVPGIGTYGNTIVDTVIDGYCRSLRIIRPTEIPIKLEIDILVRPDVNGCPAPSVLSIASGVVRELTGLGRPINGQDVTEYLIRRTVECLYPNIEVDEIRASIIPALPGALPVNIDFFEIMSVSAEHTLVVAV